ncbi:CRISPR-associated endonuclease Cas2 [Caedibacter taeniospiralis]|uniref:CRISPR-associated endonuclease Cas2 n=1 Tax=Caedibacter taeniospiralis TaxID=28907 RepID=UPI000C276A0A|nr:CRISPR-associated endonuclease Cas2 [Caedibacter taeniospiralis]
MLILITYDVSLKEETGVRRLRKIAETCQDYGVRVQNSVFECDISPDQWCVLKMKLLDSYDPEMDSLRFYKLGKNGRNKIEHYGAKAVADVFKSVLLL